MTRYHDRRPLLLFSLCKKITNGRSATRSRNSGLAWHARFVGGTTLRLALAMIVYPAHMGILAEGAIALPVTLSGGVLFAS